jgi:hypothetical protein
VAVAARPTEKQVQARVKAVLAMHGFIVSDLSQPRASMHTPGLPDLYAQHPKRGIRMWVECKRPGGRGRTASQWVWHENELESGGFVFTVESGMEMEREVTRLFETHPVRRD